MNTAIVIPAKNEQATIYNLVQSCNDIGDVIVINDGSIDNTERLARRAGAKVITHKESRHIAQSVLHGFETALTGKYDYIVQMDAGGSHHSLDMPHLLYPLEQNQADMVIGSRLIDGGSSEQPLLRWFLTRCGSMFVRFATGLEIKDLTSGYKAFNTKVLYDLYCTGAFGVIGARAHGFQFEFTQQVHLAGYRIKEVPIKYVATNSSLDNAVMWDAIKTLGRVWRRKR